MFNFLFLRKRKEKSNKENSENSENSGDDNNQLKCGDIFHFTSNTRR